MDDFSHEMCSQPNEKKILQTIGKDEFRLYIFQSDQKLIIVFLSYSILPSQVSWVTMTFHHGTILNR